MKYLSLSILLIGLLFSCAEEVEEKEEPKEETREDLIEIKDGMFTEYYPGRKSIRFQGPQDPEGRRHGIWYFYDEAGTQISMTEFRNGLKNGVSLVKHPNGVIKYTGEYKDDIQIGIWKTYDNQGKLVDTKNYTELNELSEAK